ncbi:MAG TPA: GNAT family N-acetyltransferase [Longimicrobiales bacterium]
MIDLVIEPLQTSEEVAICAEMMSQTDPWLRLGRGYTTCHDAVSAPGRNVFVARVAGEVAGCVILNLTGAFVGYIQAVCVHPSQRGKGIGSALLRFAEEYIFQRTPNVFLCVSSFNTDAQRLYSRLGYKIIGELEDYIIPGASEILLRKTIGPLD